uniref:Endonuclease/exonuclease/phosphatase domain-containing protein n=1 Tax=Kalanchoe fedtschenkoi TaxID=63787 RepID=A0A7N0VDA2_KALFE
MEFYCHQDLPDFHQFQVTILYAFNQKLSRAPLWSDLSNIALTIQAPWLVFGDFNCILSTQDKSGSDVSLRDTEELSHFCSVSNLIDVPYTGHRFTWSNRRDISTRCKLGRVMCNSNWMSAFPSSHAIFASPGVSDHSPGILKIPDANVRVSPKRRFKFCNAWILNDSFMEAVQSSWNSSGICRDLFHVHQKLRALKRSLLLSFGKLTSRISERVSAARRQLEDIQNQMISNPLNSSLQQEERDCISQLAYLSKCESIHSSQQAKIHWAKYGDLNTSYFHAAMKERSY